MENQLICPCCSKEILDGEECVVCPGCGAAHHKACWESKGGCAKEGCPSAPVAETAAPAQQEVVPQNEVVAQSFCAYCGAAMAEGQNFCSSCGQQAGGINVPGVPTQAPAKKKNLTWLWIVIGLVVALVVALVIINPFDRGEDPAANSGYQSGSGTDSGYQSGGSSSLLQSKMMANTWWSYNEEYPDLQLFLNITSTEIVYSAYGDGIGMKEVARLPYTVVNSNTVKIYGTSIDVDFTDSGSIVFTPSPFDEEDWSLWIAYE